MLIYLKGLLYSFVFMAIVGLIIAGLVWFSFGSLSNKYLLIILIITIVLSPRFEVISSQSGKSLQIKGLSIMFFNSYKNWIRRKNKK